MIHQRVWREKKKEGHSNTERDRQTDRTETKSLRTGEKTE